MAEHIISDDLGGTTTGSREPPLPNWRMSSGPVPYREAVNTMTAWADEAAAQRGPERVWFLEHPSLYTAGTSADQRHLLNPDRFPVYQTNRGGAYTYHGPGQRIVYLVLDVRRRFNGDVRAFVDTLETWLIAALARLGMEGVRGNGARGVWVLPASAANAGPEKIASIGIRIRRGVSLHGVSINVDPDLDHFSSIVACGGAGEVQTSLTKLSNTATMADVDDALKATFATVVLD